MLWRLLCPCSWPHSPAARASGWQMMWKHKQQGQGGSRHTRTRKKKTSRNPFSINLCQHECERMLKVFVSHDITGKKKTSILYAAGSQGLVPMSSCHLVRAGVCLGRVASQSQGNTEQQPCISTLLPLNLTVMLWTVRSNLGMHRNNMSPTQQQKQSDCTFQCASC